MREDRFQIWEMEECPRRREKQYLVGWTSRMIVGKYQVRGVQDGFHPGLTGLQDEELAT